MSFDPSLRRNCERFLAYKTKTHEEWIAELSASSFKEAPIDSYGEGPLVEELETRSAKLLGKPKALFFPKARAAQLLALRHWCQKAGSNKIVLHPQSHFQLDEKQSYQELFNLQGIVLGRANFPFDLEDLKTISGPVGVVTVELPLRRAGFKLTPWEKLLEIRDWTHKRGAFFHVDGARLWESAAYYNRSIDEIAQISDSIYVSLYKGLGGLGGAILAGSESFIAEIKPLRSHIGGDLFSAFPLLISGLDGLENRMGKIPQFIERAKTIANLLSEIQGVQVSPNPPHTNEFHIYLTGNAKQICRTYEEYLKEERTWILADLKAAAVPNVVAAEISVGYGSEEISDACIVDLVRSLLN